MRLAGFGCPSIHPPERTHDMNEIYYEPRDLEDFANIGEHAPGAAALSNGLTIRAFNAH
jgi:hypothetical protein